MSESEKCEDKNPLGKIFERLCKLCTKTEELVKKTTSPTRLETERKRWLKTQH